MRLHRTAALSWSVLGIVAAFFLAHAETSFANESDSLASESDGTTATFEEDFLRQDKGQPSVDLSIFAVSDRVLPGMKSVMLHLNRQAVGVRQIDFVAVIGKEDAQPCISVALLEELGVNVPAFPDLQAMDPSQCLGVLRVIPMAQAAYDQDQNILNVSIPQAALKREARGLVSRERWDDGKTVLWSSYRVSHNRVSYSGGSDFGASDSSFFSFRNGLNIGAWRLRGNGNYYRNNGVSDWNLSDLYAERSIPAWRGWMRLGDSATPGNIFNSSRFRGLQIQSDDGMLPDSMRGYAPVVRGIAPSNAKVTVRQGGYVIYTSFVPAGPFVIDDLYSTPGGGDLEVEVEELGGRTTRFFQPFAALPAMMREGLWNYNLVFGRYRNSFSSDRPMLGQLTLAYGLPWGLTSYGGWTVSQNSYQAAALGMAVNMEQLGAMSVDVTGSRSRDIRGAQQSGMAARLQYAKSFPGSGTDFTLAGYRYSSAGYRSLDDAIRENSSDNYWDAGLNRLHEYQLSLSQRVASNASLSLNYFGIAYQNTSRRSTYAQLGFSSSIGRVGYSVNYNISRSPWSGSESSVMLTLSLPLGGSHYGSYTMSHTDSRGTSHDINLSGSLREDNSLTYALQTGVTSGVATDGGSHSYGSLGYSSPVGLANVSYAYNKSSSNTNLDFSGAVLVDEQGVLLGQSLGETAVIVDAPGAAGVLVDSYPGVRTDSAGRALIPYASPYRENRISLTPDYDDTSVTLERNVQTVVPTRGAVVVAKFDTEIGFSALVVLRNPAGVELPFGAALYDEEDRQRGIVGPVGRVWLTGLQGANRFAVKWGENQEQQCSFDIDVPANVGRADMVEKELICA